MARSCDLEQQTKMSISLNPVCKNWHFSHARALSVFSESSAKQKSNAARRRRLWSSKTISNPKADPQNHVLWWAFTESASGSRERQQLARSGHDTKQARLKLGSLQ
jgi:hypothetical protein